MDVIHHVVSTYTKPNPPVTEYSVQAGTKKKLYIQQHNYFDRTQNEAAEVKEEEEEEANTHRRSHFVHKPNIIYTDLKTGKGTKARNHAMLTIPSGPRVHTTAEPTKACPTNISSKRT